MMPRIPWGVTRAEGRPAEPAVTSTQRLPAWGHAAFALPLLASASLFVAGSGVDAALCTTISALCWFSASVLRVRVGSRSVVVRVGPVGQTIPIASIGSVGVLGVHEPPPQVRARPATTTRYGLFGSKGRWLRIEWVDTAGRRRDTHVKMRRPWLAASAIEAQLALLRAPRESASRTFASHDHTRDPTAQMDTDCFHMRTIQLPRVPH